MLRLIEGLHDTAKVTVVLLEEGPMVSRYRDVGARVELLALTDRALDSGRQRGGQPRAAPSYLGVMHRLHRLIRRTDPDVVAGNTLKGSAVAGPTARLAGRPFVWMARDRLSPDYVSGLSRQLFRWLLRLTASGVVANSHSTAKSLPAHRRTLVLHDPLGPEFFGRANARPPGPIRTVGMVGRLAEWKGHRLFLAAFAEVFGGGSVQARIVGDASGSDAVSIGELQQYAAELGVAEQVTFTGHVDDTVAEYLRIDLFVHCSLIPEPFGQVVAEAMASGCLVVAPDQGGPSELVRPGVNGIAYALGSHEALAASLRRAADLLPEDRKALVRCGQQTALSLNAGPVAAVFLEFAAGS